MSLSERLIGQTIGPDFADSQRGAGLPRRKLRAAWALSVVGVR